MRTVFKDKFMIVTAGAVTALVVGIGFTKKFGGKR